MKQRGGSGEAWELANPDYYKRLYAMTPAEQAIFLEQERIRVEEQRRIAQARTERLGNSLAFKLYNLINTAEFDKKFTEPFSNRLQELVRVYYFEIIKPQMASIRSTNYIVPDEAIDSFKHIVKQFIDDGVAAFKPWITSYFKSYDSKYRTFQRLLAGYNALFPGRGGSRKRTKKTKNRRHTAGAAKFFYYNE
jgi:hypothetical protein